MHHIFDDMFSDLPRVEYYRSLVVPEMYPGQSQPRLSNWNPEDLTAFCGIYARGN